MNIINGKEVSKKTREKVALMVKDFIAEKGRIPCLAVILVGEDPASQTYVKNKMTTSIKGEPICQPTNTP